MRRKYDTTTMINPMTGAPWLKPREEANVVWSGSIQAPMRHPLTYSEIADVRKRFDVYDLEPSPNRDLSGWSKVGGGYSYGAYGKGFPRPTAPGQKHDLYVEPREFDRGKGSYREGYSGPDSRGMCSATWERPGVEAPGDSSERTGPNPDPWAGYRGSGGGGAGPHICHLLLFFVFVE